MKNMTAYDNLPKEEKAIIYIKRKREEERSWKDLQTEGLLHFWSEHYRITAVATLPRTEEEGGRIRITHIDQWVYEYNQAVNIDDLPQGLLFIRNAVRTNLRVSPPLEIQIICDCEYASQIIGGATYCPNLYLGKQKQKNKRGLNKNARTGDFPCTSFLISKITLYTSQYTFDGHYHGTSQHSIIKS